MNNDIKTLREAANYIYGLTPTGHKLKDELLAIADRMEKAEPVAFRWRKRGSNDTLDWRYCHDLKQIDDADVLKVTEIELVYLHPASDEVERLKAELATEQRLSFRSQVADLEEQLSAIKNLVEKDVAEFKEKEWPFPLPLHEAILNTINQPKEEKKC